MHCPAALCLCAARWGLGSCGLHGAAPMRRHLRDDGTCGMTCQGGEAREGSGLGFFLPKSKFAIQEITSYFSSEAHFCPLRVLRGDMDQRCTVAGKIKLRSGISCFIPYVYIFLAPLLPISFTPSPQEEEKNQTQTARALFLFPWEFCERGRL